MNTATKKPLVRKAVRELKGLRTAAKVKGGGDHCCRCCRCCRCW